MIEYPTKPEARFTFKLGGRIERGKPWPRADGMPIKGGTDGLTILEETIAPLPVYDASTHKLSAGYWIDDDANQAATFTRDVVPLTAEEASDAADEQDRATKRGKVRAIVATLRDWEGDAEGVTVTNGNNTAVTQTLVDRLGKICGGLADLIEGQHFDT